MRPTIYGALGACLILLSTVSSHAAPISGQGSWETTLQARDLDGDLATIEAYYDTVRNVTWLADANYARSSGYSSDGRMDWVTANNWASSLDLDGTPGADGWRLPTVTDTGAPGCQWAYSGTDCGFNVNTATGEMASLFYDTLGNLALYNTSGGPQPGGLSNTGPFTNIVPGFYWTATSNVAYEPFAWGFDFSGGSQNTGVKTNLYYAWAVRAGDFGTPLVDDPCASHSGDGVCLSVVEHQATSTDFYETTPTLGNDGTGDLVVYTSRELLNTGMFDQADIWYQRLNPDGSASGAPEQVTASKTDDVLNDVSGNYIVYTAYDDVFSPTGSIMLYNIATKEVQALGEAGFVRDPKIYGDFVVWEQGTSASSQVVVYNITTKQQEPIACGTDSLPPCYMVQIGSRFVVWATIDGPTGDKDYDIEVFDFELNAGYALTNSGQTDEKDPTTSGDWVAWAAYDASSPNGRIEAYNGRTGELRIISNDGSHTRLPSVDGPLIAWESNSNGNFDVWVHRFDTMETFQVTDHAGDQYLNDLYGNMIAYVDQRHGNEDIFVSALQFNFPDPCAGLGGDSDGDGHCDAEDNCPLVTNADQADNDGDGIGNACDLDSDGDGVDDDIDNCALTPNPLQEDTDGDGLGDVCDDDLDGDGVPDVSDNCPLVPNSFQEDTDGDGIGDDCDEDLDNDGICNIAQVGATCTEGPDNCVSIVNPGQEDLDFDGIGDACDADVDGDGADDDVDNCPLVSNPDQNDTDFDLLGDACDIDDDNDGILDDADNCQFISNADQSDGDGDGAGDVCDGDLDGDGVDNASDNCPLIPNSGQGDFDGDGLGDACDGDIDGDGVANDDDVCAGTAIGGVIDPASGCTLDQLVPCEGPRGTTVEWKNHGKYVSAIAHAANEFLRQGLITESERDAIMSDAAQSSCGSK